MDYKSTLNLPQTSFSMRANSVNKEPALHEFWKNQNIYQQNLEQRKKPPFILHDGPPYLSSGKIHIGHALNRILKDIVVKYKTLNGHPSPLIFGYDCHGLPIENEVSKKKKIDVEQEPLKMRLACHDFALKNLEGQSQNFYRLGLMGNWDKPYLTLQPHYEAAQLRVFAEMVEKGYIYKGLKPVYWSIAAQSALAEAEVEYKDHTSHSIYVKFPITAESLQKLPEALAEREVSFVIWTTTPWTLPANLGIALNPAFNYQFVETTQGTLVVAEKLKETVFKECGLTEQQVLFEAKGQELENILCAHPFYDKTSRVVLGNHVTSEAGTGCVHTAPGHGMEDFIVGEKYKLGVLSPVDKKGVFTEEAPLFTGLFYAKANEPIIELLKEKQRLLFHTTFVHSYPHCWRTKTPVIYRATEQWFASVDGFRAEALKAVDTVQWIPSGGKERIHNMINDRTDWCISRQRVWGVPIPAFYTPDSNTAILEKDLILHVADLVEKEGSNVWWTKSSAELLPENFSFEGHPAEELRKETDIMDVWFDSGTSHSGVVKYTPELTFPADLYLEGSDQHRGWFQSSLLTSIAAYGVPPYKTVLTHGFVLDGEGKKMSKSVGNVVEPQKVIQQYGADVLRLWVASVDYTSDVKVSYDILKQLAEIYKKVRNTIRFLISNLYDFNPETDMLPYEKLSELDKFTLHKLENFLGQVKEHFESYAFYKFYQTLQNFCVIDLSNLYFMIVKDILYIESQNSDLRRSVQTVLWKTLHTLLGTLTPVLTHMAEDALQNLPDDLKRQYGESILLSDFPSLDQQYHSPELADKWVLLMDLRDGLNQALETARKEKTIGRSMEARAHIYHKDQNLVSYIKEHQELFRQVFILSELSLVDEPPVGGIQSHQTEDFTVSIDIASGEKCERCWGHFDSVGSHSEHPSLCTRCTDIVTQI